VLGAREDNVPSYRELGLRAIHKFNSVPRWVPRYLVYQSAADLPAILTAILSAEGYLPFYLKRAAEEPAGQLDPAVSGAVP